MNQNERNAKRITELESSLMHLQNDYDSLNEVVLDQAKRLDQLTGAFDRLSERLDAATPTAPPRKAEDEVPPHY